MCRSRCNANKLTYVNVKKNNLKKVFMKFLKAKEWNTWTVCLVLITNFPPYYKLFKVKNACLTKHTRLYFTAGIWPTQLMAPVERMSWGKNPSIEEQSSSFKLWTAWTESSVFLMWKGALPAKWKKRNNVGAKFRSIVSDGTNARNNRPKQCTLFNIFR